MAKERNILDQNTQKPSSAIITDYSPEQQPDGLTYALNANTQTSEGDKGNRTVEEGNQVSGNISSGYIVMGRGYTNDGRNILFSVSSDESRSEIGIADKNSVYIPIVNSGVLGFRLNKQIQCVYRLRRGCEDVIYFTDGNQSMRNFNFARPQDYYNLSYKDFLSSGLSGSFSGEKWDAEKFSLFLPYGVPCFTKLEVSTGGSVVPGTYNFAIQYLDDNLNPTNWIYNSQLVPIFASDNTGDFNNILGSSNVLADDISGIISTTKSIKLTLGRLDTTYKFYKIAVIEATGGTGLVTRVIASPVYPIGSKEFIFDGNLDGYTIIDDASVLGIGKTDIDAVQHIEQIENRLLLANVRGKQVPYCNFQAAASQIVSNYVISEVKDQDADQDGNSKDPNTYWDKQGYMGDEVYAMGIVFVFSDGLETPAYHIPGRAPGKYKNTLTGEIVITDDQDIITSFNNDVTPWYQDVASYNSFSPAKKLKKWQVYDTSEIFSPEGQNESIGAMSYWENKDANYTTFSDCSQEDYWGTDAYGNSLLGQPVRHHKFPSRAKEPHIRRGDVFTGSTGLFYDVVLNSGQTYPSGGYTLTINYDINGVPNTYTATITSDQLPIDRFLVDEVNGDFNDIAITSVTGTITSDDAAKIVTINIYRDVLDSTTVTGTIIRNLGIQFSNITYPHPDIVGHYFVRGARDNQNRTVLDKGFAGNLSSKNVNGTTYKAFAYFTENGLADNYNNYLFTPRFLFNKELLTGDYLKYEAEFQYQNGFVSSENIDGKGSAFSETDTYIEVREQAYNGLNFDRSDHNFKVNKGVVLGATEVNSTFLGAADPLYNLSWSNRLHALNTYTQFPNPGRNVPYVSYKIDQNVHPVLSEITYQRTHNCMLTLQDNNIVFGGDTFINYLNLCNSLYRRRKSGVLKTILSVVTIAAAVVATVATAGVGAPLIAAAVGAAAAAGIASAIVVTAVVAGIIGVTGDTIKFITSQIDSDLGQLADDSQLANATGTGWKLSAYVAYANEFMQSLYVESEVNVGLRQTENHICGDFYRYQAGTIQDYFKNRWMYYDQASNKYLQKGYCCPEVYHYNLDYSRQNLQSLYFPLAETYDCCSDCSESHPDRIHYSEQAFQEELTDNYKVFLPNNYVDIEAEHGGITNIIKRNNNLFINTSEALFVLPESQQEKVDGELTTYIGTGAFFSIPPKKIIDSELGSGGSQHKWATLSLERGLLLINELEGRISLIDKSTLELSKQGNETWFRNNLQDFFARQFKAITNIDFPNVNNPANPHGVGIHSVYDARYNRILITKRDYLLLPQYISQFQVVNTVSNILPTGLPSNILVFDLTLSKFIITTSNPAIYSFAEFSNKDMFQDRSFTISFSLEGQVPELVSWHSYIPTFYFYDHRELYSLIPASNHIWKHNIKGLYQSYYGKSYPHIIEIVLKSNPTETRYWEDISLQTIAKKYDQDTDEFNEQRFVTFNKLIAYNKRQVTGMLNLKPKNEVEDDSMMIDIITETLNQIFITRTEEDWYFNQLRDYRDDYSSPMFSKNWSDLKSTYPIDKVLNISNININKDWSQLEVLRDKFIILRLIFDNFTDIQLSTNYIQDTSGESMR